MTSPIVFSNSLELSNGLILSVILLVLQYASVIQLVLYVLFKKNKKNNTIKKIK